MSRQKQSRQKQKKNNDGLLNGNYALLPIIFVLCIVPLIMRLYIYDSGLEQYPWFPDRTEEVDIFLYYKSVAMTAAGVVMAGILAYFTYKEQKKKKNDFRLHPAQAKWLLPLAAFCLLVLLSTLFSQYRGYGFNGIYEQFESVWVVLAYGIATVYTFYFIKTKGDIDVIQKALFCVLTVLGVLGITQLTGHDFWETNLGKSLFVPAQYAQLKESLEFSFSGSGNHQVYLTFYNPNYVGVFAALILPVSVMLCVGNEKWQKKAAWGILSIVLLLCALGSGSKAFLLSLIATSLLGIVLYGRKLVKYLPIGLMYGATILYVGSVYMNYVNIDVVQYVKNALTPTENVYPVEDFVVTEDHVELTYNGEVLSMLCENGSDGTPYFKAWDSTGADMAFSMDDANVVHFEDERFAAIAVTVYGGYEEYAYIAEISAAGHRYGFAKGSDSYTYINFAYKADEMIKAESALFTDSDRLFSGRGYIWSRTIPLLKDSIFLGTGADTFVLAFPQKDYVARTNAGYQDQIMTKPHSLYLQMGVQYGVLALLAFVALAVMYAVEAVRLCWRADFRDTYSCLALGLLMGIAGYGIMGISNDSCVALAPMAWILLGFGFAVNQVVKKELEEKTAA